jgi:hypothetical protein
MRPAVDEPDAPDVGGRRLRRVVVITGITLIVLILVAVAVYVIAFIILAPMMG